MNDFQTATSLFYDSQPIQILSSDSIFLTKSNTLKTHHRVLKKKNIGILITDHNVQETLAITDRTYLMFEGKILKEGIPEELAKDEIVRKVYLGKNFEFKRKNLRACATVFELQSDISNMM